MAVEGLEPRKPSIQNVKEAAGGPRAYRRVGTAEKRTTSAMTASPATATNGSTNDGAPTAAAPKLAALTQTTQAWPLACAAESYEWASEKASASTNNATSSVPTQTFMVGRR